MSEEQIEAYKSKNYNKCIEIGLENVSQNFFLEQSLYYLGKAYSKLGKYEEAKQNLEECIKINSSNYEAQYSLAGVYVNLKQYAKAYRVYKLIEDKTNMGKTATLHNQLCFCLYQMRRYSRAECEASTAMYFDGEGVKNGEEKDKTCRIYKVCTLNECEKYEQALIFIDHELSDCKESDSDVIEQICFALFGLEKYEECREKCRRYLANAPNLYYYLAYCDYTEKKYQSALNYINKGIEKNTVILYKMLYLKALILKALNDYKTALNCLERSIKEKPKFLESYIEASVIFQLQGRLRNAELVLNMGNKTIDEEDEKEGELYFHLMRADVLYRQGKRDDATKLVEYVRKILCIESTENEISKKRLIELLSKYFELYIQSKGYSKNDLIFTMDEKSQIGHGGFGLVYKGKLHNKEVAIKNFKMKISDEMTFDKLFEGMTNVFHELSTMEILKHKYILDICAIVLDGSELFLVTPLCKGGNLCSVLRDTNIKMSIKSRIKIALQLAEALNYMHNGITNVSYIHHDLKSMNVLLTEKYNDYGNNQIKLCDFGGTRTGRSFHSAFTPGWAAPEIASYNPYDYKVDIFSYGVTLWEIFSRKIPFSDVPKDEIFRKVQFGERPSIDELEPDTPSEIKMLMQNCWKEDKDERPMDKDIIETLRKLI